MQVCTHSYAHAHTATCAHTHIHAYTLTHTERQTHACMHTNVYTHTYTCTHMHARTHTRTHTHTLAHRHTQTHTKLVGYSLPHCYHAVVYHEMVNRPNCHYFFLLEQYVIHLSHTYTILKLLYIRYKGKTIQVNAILCMSALQSHITYIVF